jgi:hypothetical protein
MPRASERHVEQAQLLLPKLERRCRGRTVPVARARELEVEPKLRPVLDPCVPRERLSLVGGLEVCPAEGEQHDRVFQALALVDRDELHGASVAFQTECLGLVGPIARRAARCPQPAREARRTHPGAPLLGVAQLDEVAQIGGIALPLLRSQEATDHAEFV